MRRLLLGWVLGVYGGSIELHLYLAYKETLLVLYITVAVSYTHLTLPTKRIV